MNLSIIRYINKDNLVGFILATIVFGGLYLKEQNRLDTVRNQLDAERDKFDQYRTTENQKIQGKELELSKRELHLKELQDQVNQKSKQADANLFIANEAMVHIKHDAQTLSPIEALRQEKIRIDKLEDDFTKLGVDLNKPPPCNVTEQQKYNQAKAILDLIISESKSSGLFGHYKYFIESNARTFYESSDCTEQKPN